ncbi:MAG TPA: hypothetical protein VFL83_20620 [Anaeromyxobacter sp.]|nr:hypothetical protein [Anaeromyxobacter sp.]
MPTERFRFREDVLRAAAARTRRRFATTLVATAAVIVAVWSAALRPQGAGWGTLAFSLALLLALAAVSMGRRMRRLHARWGSFEIALGEDAIGREVSGFAPVRIARADVEAVGERADGLVVRGRGGVLLLVPREIDGYARLRAAVAAWAPPPGPPGGA